MFCSAVIPTINRPTLTRAVMSVLNQEFDPDLFEVIVVNDSGEPLPATDWHSSGQVHIITTQNRERSVARNTGAATARGEYLYFLDDDDVMLPGAMRAFWEMSQASDAAWLYGNYQVVDNAGNVLEEFHPDLAGNISALLIAGEGIPLQASLVRTKCFYEAGEFDPVFTGTQDRDLCRRIALLGAVAKTNATVSQIRIGQIGSSTAWETLPGFDRLGREKALSRPGAFHHLWDSAEGSSYLHGRVSRAYLASAGWNLRRGKLLALVDRLVSMVLFGLAFILSPEFWKGVRTHVQPLGQLKRTREPSRNWLIPVTLEMATGTILYWLLRLVRILR